MTPDVVGQEGLDLFCRRGVDGACLEFKRFKHDSCWWASRLGY